MENKIKWHKPSLIKRLLIKLRIIKDKKYDGKKINTFLLDEAAHWQDPNLNHNKYWRRVKEGKKLKKMV